MANIRNSISLQDHMTPVFRSIMRSMDSTLRLMRQVDRASNNGVQSRAYRSAARDIQRANNELTRMQNNLRRTDSEANKLRTTMNGVGSSISNFKLTNLASGIYLIKNALNALSSGMAIPDNLNQAQYRLGQFDKTGASGSQLYNAVYKTALDSRADLGATADLASRVLISGATKGNGGAAVHMAGLLNKSSLIGGATQEESKRALLQLSQGLSSGVLQGDELRAIREQAPGLTDVLARGLSSMAEKGLLPENFLDTSVGDLKELGSAGELTADRIIAAFSEMEDYINETFEKSPKTFGQAMTGIATVWKNFFKQMSQSDKALGKITEKAWELLDYFTSPAGEKFFNDLSTVINTAAGVLLGLVDIVGNAIGKFFEMENAAQILQAAFIGVAVAATAAGIASLVAFLAANWVAALVIAAVALIAYGLMELGLTAGQVIGGIVGVVLFAVYFIWDLCVWLIALIVAGIIGLVTIVINVVQFIVQLVLWLITTIWQFLKMLDEVFRTVWYGFQVIVGGVCVGIAQIFQVLATTVLGILYGIAAAIDWVFGSNLADKVGGWISGLDGAVDDLEATFNANVVDGAKDVGDSWKNWATDAGAMYAGSGKYDDWNIMDNLGDTFMGGMGLTADSYNYINGAQVDPMAGWNAGMGMGQGIDDMLGALDTDSEGGLGDLSELLAGIAGDGVKVNGGEIDGIKSDVDISDEDIQLLRDIAARDFLLNVKTVTPKANIKFGDVRETADVNKIMDVIEDMVEEQLATALVVE